MKKTYFAAAGTAFVLAASVSTVALAWHPQGKIVKEVSNVTANGAYADANDGSTAITAKPGDTLSYRITITNPADPAANQDNDLAKIKVTDNLPAGVTLASGSKDKDFGSTVVVPQNSSTGNKSATYNFTVKVNSDVKDGTLICNTAMYTGNSAVGDAPRSGEDSACVKVVVPPAPKQIQVCDLTTKKIVMINETDFNSAKYSKNLDDCKEVPVTPTTPTTPETPATPELPSTGPSALGFLAAPSLAGLAYGATALIRRR